MTPVFASSIASRLESDVRISNELVTAVVRGLMKPPRITLMELPIEVKPADLKASVISIWGGFVAFRMHDERFVVTPPISI